MKTQASNTYQAYKHRCKQIKNPFLKLSTFMDSGVLFFPVLSSPFPSFSLCCSCVVSALFHFPFFALAHSDAFNASRVMQVWLSVSVDRQPTLKRCKCPALWSEHGKLEMSL